MKCIMNVSNREYDKDAIFTGIKLLPKGTEQSHENAL